jgi:hypothetical protein
VGHPVDPVGHALGPVAQQFRAARAGAAERRAQAVQQVRLQAQPLDVLPRVPGRSGLGGHRDHRLVQFARDLFQLFPHDR